MKMLLAAIVLFFQAGSVLAGVCRPIEYAELKDTPSKNLVLTYCLNEAQAGGVQEHMKKLNDMHSDELKERPASPSILADIQKHYDGALVELKECFEQQNKIRGVLSNRSEPAVPSCDGPLPAVKK